MKKKTSLLVTFSLLTVTNLFIYVKRDRFAYSSQPSAASLYAACDNNCTKKWKQFVDDYPTNQLKEASACLDSSLQLTTVNTIDKLLQIGNFLRSHFQDQHGTPSALVSSSTPFEQYKLLRRDTSEKLWCGNYAYMFAWFCWSKGITTRIIEIIKPRDHHLINECYIPEKKQWVMVDITNNLLLVEDSLGQALHTLDFLKKVEDNSNLPIYSSDNNSIQKESLNTKEFSGKKHFQKKYPLHYYERINLKAVYSRGQKLKRYILPVSWYSVYRPHAHSKGNFSYFLKIFFICVWLVTIFGLLRLFLIPRK